MATLLENYKIIVEGIADADTPVTAHDLRACQEVLYRISVLETWRLFTDFALDASNDAINEHRQLFCEFCGRLPGDHLMGDASPSEEQVKMAGTAQKVLKDVVADCITRLSAYRPGNEEVTYQAAVAQMVKTISPVWLQFRKTLFDI